MTYEAFDDLSLAFETRQLHAGYEPALHNRSKAVPIYQSAAHQFGGFERCQPLLSGEEEGDTYVRMSNPTNAVLERRMAALEGGAASVAMSSGMAAVSNTLLNLTRPGDEIVAAGTVYGGTGYLLAEVLPGHGVTTTWVQDPDDPEAFRGAITERTKAVHIEALGNPSINVIDIEAIAAIAHEHGIPLVVDATLATPYLLRPIEFGADIVCHSATKYLSGHGTTLAGVVTEKGGFDWANGNFPHINAFIDGGVGSVGSDHDPRRTLFTRRLRHDYMAELGGQLEPMSAFLLLQGLETLSLRMERHAENAITVASFLEAHPAVSSVTYPSLPSSPYHALAREYFPRGSGAMVAVRLDGGPDAARRMIERLRVFDFSANVGGSRSRITHPATSTHSGLSDPVRERAGVFDDSLRISVGTEDVGDLIRDLRQALATEAATVVVPPRLARLAGAASCALN